MARSQLAEKPSSGGGNGASAAGGLLGVTPATPKNAFEKYRVRTEGPVVEEESDSRALRAVLDDQDGIEEAEIEYVAAMDLISLLERPNYGQDRYDA